MANSSRHIVKSSHLLNGTLKSVMGDQESKVATGAPWAGGGQEADRSVGKTRKGPSIHHAMRSKRPHEAYPLVFSI